MSVQNLESMKEELARYMNPSRRKLLFLLSQESPRKMPELSRLAGLSERTCKASIQRLLEFELVQVRDGLNVSLTNTGRAYVNQLKVSFRPVVTADTGE